MPTLHYPGAVAYLPGGDSGRLADLARRGGMMSAIDTLLGQAAEHEDKTIRESLVAEAVMRRHDYAAILAAIDEAIAYMQHVINPQAKRTARQQSGDK